MAMLMAEYRLTVTRRRHQPRVLVKMAAMPARAAGLGLACRAGLA